MSLTVENVITASPGYRRVGSQRKTVSRVTFDNSYQSEGEPLTFKELRLGYVEFASCTLVKGSESAVVRPVSAEYTPSTEKIHLLDAATGKEVASTSDMSKVVVQVEAYGTP